LKILIVDDEDDIRRIGRLSLAHLGGMEVVEAASGSEGIERAAAEKPDGILLDLMMPGLDGRETLAGLRAHASTSDIPVIFLTAKPLDQEGPKLRELSVAGVLAKPFDPIQLPREVQALLEKR